MPNFKPDYIRQRKLLDVDFLEVIGGNIAHSKDTVYAL